jgi:(p)ppGpp synthase/HD superfamily hydrolase
METTILTSSFEKALAYAFKAHLTQFRKGTGTPYISHPLAVASIVLENGGDETAAIGALLHDVAEDQGGEEKLDEIKALFGAEVAGIVASLSDAMPAKGEKKGPWRERKEIYLAHLPHATSASQLVSAADKLHNLRSILADYGEIGEQVFERFSAKKEGTLWYYRSLLKIFEISALPKRLTRDLSSVFDSLQRLALSDSQSPDSPGAAAKSSLEV